MAEQLAVQIPQSDPEVCRLWLTVRREAGLSQAGRHVEVGEGDPVPHDSSRPCQAPTGTGDRPDVSSLIRQLPRARVPPHSGTLDRLTLTRVQGQTDIGALFRHHLTGLMNHAPQYEEHGAPRPADVTPDPLSAMADLAAMADRAENLLPAETRQTALRTQINEFIQRHLADPDLAPASIAAAHHISVRYLHRLYQGQEATITAGIRRTRLERIHRDLADPRLNARSISTIAALWGFPEPTSFSRAFKTLYGTTPRDHRQQAQAPHGPSTAWPKHRMAQHRMAQSVR